MKSTIIQFAATVSTATAIYAAQPEDHLVFEGSEGLLAKEHGFKCTVLFSLDDKGIVSPKAQGSLSHSQSLDSADLIVMSIRFRNEYPFQKLG